MRAQVEGGIEINSKDPLLNRKNKQNSRCHLSGESLKGQSDDGPSTTFQLVYGHDWPPVSAVETVFPLGGIGVVSGITLTQSQNCVPIFSDVEETKKRDFSSRDTDA